MTLKMNGVLRALGRGALKMQLLKLRTEKDFPSAHRH
jgi:hypothetical protein